MLLIPCPWCGKRAHIEFTYGGAASSLPPPQNAALDDVAWTEHLYLRDNPRGLHEELWRHSSGCRQWFKIRRDTVSHEIAGAENPSGEAGAR
jgi:sarcosine oxidase subunit delta